MLRIALDLLTEAAYALLILLLLPATVFFVLVSYEQLSKLPCRLSSANNLTGVVIEEARVIYERGAGLTGSRGLRPAYSHSLFVVVRFVQDGKEKTVTKTYGSEFLFLMKRDASRLREGAVVNVNVCEEPTLHPFGSWLRFVTFILMPIVLFVFAAFAIRRRITTRGRWQPEFRSKPC
jgi:hypothetical protein